MKPTNPFLISGYYSPEYFCDRRKETQTIIEALHNGRNLTLIAPRRMGKTGLIRHTFYKLHESEPDTITLYMDIFSTQNIGDFTRLFANTVLGKLDSTPQSALNRVAKFIKSCRPVFTFDETTGMPKATVEVAQVEEQATLKEIFDYLKSTGKRCYIAIDEFQQITNYPEKGVEALLRSYIQFVQNINFIFSGSKQHVMQEMFLSSQRPFYQSTQTVSIDRIDRKEYYGFAVSFFKKIKKELRQDTFDFIYDNFDGYTWYIQAILNRLYSYGATIDETSIRDIIGEIVAESAYTYGSMLSAYPAGCTRLLKAIALEGCVKEITSGDFIARHNLKAASSVNRSLKKLVDSELVYRTTDGYIVYDRFMNEWLRNQRF
ncbi:MAG: ATP-binding protein [Bacteroidales bacterium]|jgi:AAA+ ATPase superfamily predicted ATPase|nr:ATP-binding protein [Bacteroidales bacterium]MCI2145397.1 ATP-binding protein [Bacteroidales bacterium]